MAEPEVQIVTHQSPDEASGDMEMASGDIEIIEVLGSRRANGHNEETEVNVSPRMTFTDYLRSPLIEIEVGNGDSQTILTAHQALLVQSPFFAAAVAEFSSDATTRRVKFVNEDLDAVGCFLQFIYTGEYFPRKQADGLEPTGDGVNDPGAQLLKHAKVYTLAEKLGMTDLKALAHSKVHRVNATAQGEIAYARYVYANTPRDDITIRKPIASFWGQRSHILRHESEEEFRSLCLEFPEFSFDVLTYVLDAREKKFSDRMSDEPKSARKRNRQS